MPACVESMFYVSNEQNERFVPWHGLGTSVEEAPTSKDAIHLAGLDWNVESKAIYDANGNEIPGYKANTRDSDNSVLGIVSNKYKIVQNTEAFEFTDALLGADEGVRYETAGSLHNGKMPWLLAKMPTQKILDDAVEPYICFVNTHDGSCSIRVCMTTTRVVCNNTLNLALSTARRTWTARHMGNVIEKLDEAKHTLGLAKKYMENLDEEADRLANIKIDDEKLNDILLAMFPIDYEKDSARKIQNINELKANFMKCYMMPDIAKFKGTGWGVMNAVSDLVCHYAPSRMTEKYQENNWGKIISGHPLMDEFYTAVKTISK